MRKYSKWVSEASKMNGASRTNIVQAVECINLWILFGVEKPHFSLSLLHIYLIILFAGLSFVSNSTLNAMFSAAYVCSTIINACLRTIQKYNEKKKKIIIINLVWLHNRNEKKTHTHTYSHTSDRTKVKIKCQQLSDGLNNPQSEGENSFKRKFQAN